jgi:peptidase E
MKLFLLSKHYFSRLDQQLNKWTQKSSSNIAIGFCSDAAVNSQKKDFVNNSLSELKSFNYKIEIFTLSDYSHKPDKFSNFLSKLNATMFTGGSVNDLAKTFSDTGLLPTYKQSVSNFLIHMGFSAGAMICGPSLQYTKSLGEYHEIHYDTLDIFPHQVFPHYSNKPKYTKSYQDYIQNNPHPTKYSIPLTNNQAIIVDDDNWRIIDRIQ